jgi:hypothetical protein
MAADIKEDNLFLCDQQGQGKLVKRLRQSPIKTIAE